MLCPDQQPVRSACKKACDVTCLARAPPAATNNMCYAVQNQQTPASTSIVPRSSSHRNLRQGLDKLPSVLPTPQDQSVPVASGPNMRRTTSKLSLDTLASIESMSCTIIDYSQLEIKRKIGDGSIGQVQSTIITTSACMGLLWCTCQCFSADLLYRDSQLQHCFPE